jgi:hypothetical protein
MESEKCQPVCQTLELRVTARDGRGSGIAAHPALGLANRGNVEKIGFYGGSQYALSRPMRVAGGPVPGRL